MICRLPRQSIPFGAFVSQQVNSWMCAVALACHSAFEIKLALGTYPILKVGQIDPQAGTYAS